MVRYVIIDGRRKHGSKLLYWSNDYGWTSSRNEATEFSEHEREAFNLPFDGEWDIMAVPECKPDIITPFITMNGSTLQSLIDDLGEVYVALGEALDKLRQRSPHGRDYMQGCRPGEDCQERFKLAQEQHKRRMNAIQDLRRELLEQIEQMRNENPNAR